MSESHFARDGLVSEHNKEPLSKFYAVDKNKMGEGSFGSVAKGKSKANEQIVAIKSIQKKQVKEAEIKIMKALDHPNIVRLYETFEDSKMLYLVMELCEGGELFDKIIDDGFFSEVDAARCMTQILGAMFYLHKNNITHRDLKPENFLLQSKAKDAPIKVIDFGLSCKFVVGKPLSTKAGTPYYVAPQVLKGSTTTRLTSGLVA
jgi:calcium-dependent protein kinase